MPRERRVEVYKKANIDRTDYVPDRAGTQLNFQMMSEAVAAFRATSQLPSAPLEAIRKDAGKRGKKFFSTP